LYYNLDTWYPGRLVLLDGEVVLRQGYRTNAEEAVLLVVAVEV